jgi:DNA-directed RNA polymerase subunit N
LDGLNISDSFYKTLSSLKKMLVPVRCFTCGNLVANKHAEYSARIKAGEDPGKVMDSLNIKRYCCRRMFTSTVETIYQVIPYYEALRRRMSEIQSEME